MFCCYFVDYFITKKTKIRYAKFQFCILNDFDMQSNHNSLKSIFNNPTYFYSSKNKTRLKTCIGFHFMLSVLMALKLLPEVLDKLDVFVLEIEELLIPKVILTNTYGSSLTKIGVTSIVNVKDC